MVFVTRRGKFWRKERGLTERERERDGVGNQGIRAGQPFILCDANLNGMWADHMPLASPERMEKLKVVASGVLAGQYTVSALC